MPPSTQPLVYLILGAAGSGRREVLADLAEGGLGEGAQAAVLLAEGEAADTKFDGKLPGLARWVWRDGFIFATLPPGASHVFLVANGRANPVDQIEAFKPWLETQGGELARVLCVVNCQLAEHHPPLLPWFEACIHFADVVLFTHRAGVANKWLSSFLAHFQGQFFPCLFESVKTGRVKNPALVLDPQARRMSHLFEKEPEWIFTDADGKEMDEQDEADDEDEVSVAPEEDPYLIRDAAGRRVKILPEIAKYLPPPSA